MKSKMFLALSIICLMFWTSLAFADTHDITAYGATANNGSDDTAAINSAINAASAGDTVHFPAGTFDISGRVDGKSGVTLAGAGQASTTVKKMGTTGGHMIEVANKSNVTIRDLTINGNNSSYAYNGICVSGSGNILISKVTIRDIGASGEFGPHGIYFSGSAVDSEISDCTISNIGLADEWGAGIRFGDGSNRNKALRNTIRDTGRGGILCNSSTDLIIKNNDVKDVGRAVHALSIEVFGACDRAVIEDNNCDSWISLDSSRFVAVRRNIVSDNTYTYAFSFCGLESAGGSDCVFTDNLVDDGQQVGVSISSGSSPVEYFYFGYNTIKACAQWGAQLQGTPAAPIQKFYFYKTSFQNTTYGQHNPLWAGSEGHGFRMNENCNNIALDNCTISGNAKLGVQINQSGVDKLSFVNDVIQNNGDSAFSGYSVYSALEMANNTISGNANNSAPAAASFNNNKPTAVISSAASANVGQAISFDSSSSSDSDGSIAHRLWDFGDGIPTDAVSASHAYAVAGTYRVTLIVWDNGGRAARVEKSVVIGGSNPPPPSNVAPTVSLTSPANGATFTAPASVTINATAADTDGTVTKVEFYQGPTKLGEDTTSPYSFTWSSVAAGSYTLTAKATDNSGAVTTSAGISITVGTSGSGGTTTDYEAESGTFGIGAQIQSASSASGGQVIGNINNVGAYDQVGSVNGGAGGVATVVIRYSNGYSDNRSLSLYANGNKVQQIVFAPTGGWNTFQDTASIGITLNAGTGNTIKIQRDASDAPAVDVDKYTVTIASNTPPPPANVSPTVSVTSPANGASFTAPASVTINATAADSDGTVSKVEFFQGTTKLGEDTTSPYSFTWSSVAAGAYTLTAKATDNGGASTASAGIGISVAPAVPVPGGSGSISREVWTGVSGNSVADIPVATTPNISDTLTSLEAPTDWADSYGTRIRGYITAPYTGSYTFWVASDDNSQLWLSSNDQPANKALIASVSSWTPSRAWNTFASQKSAAITLTAGQKYYVEVLQKEGGGGDNLAVGWAKPGESTSAPSEVVPGEQLSPWVAAPVLPEGFSVVNFGGASGAASHSSSVFTITSDGLNIWGASDDATFVKKSVSGVDVTVTAALQSIGNTSGDAAVGIMIRESDTAGSRQYNLRVLPSGGVRIVFRSAMGGESAYEAGSNVTLPVNVKIEKTGNTYKSFYQNGTTWVQIGTAQTLAMGDNVQVGMTVQANASPRTTTTGVVANFVVTASTPPPPIPVPAVPAGLSAVAGNSQVALSWTAASGAASYNVKRATTSGGPYTTLASPTTTSYTDTSAVNGTAYYYVVSAVNVSGESANSAQVSAAPQNVLPTVSVTGPANGATFTSPATVTINATAADQDGTVTKVEFFQGTTKLGEDTTSPYSFSWTSVAAGAYTLTARATDNNGGLTTSAGIGITVAIPIPSVPAGLSAVAGNAQVALSWNSASGAASYNVKRATTSGGPYTALASPTATSYTDASAVNGTTYYYVISAVNASGESANSAQVSAMPINPQGTYGNSGNPWAISSTATVRIEAENYDTGGEGIAYHDADVANNGGAYRTAEAVDVEGCQDAGGSYNVGWTAAGEWLEYTVNVPAAGTYNLKLRTARVGNGSVRVLFNGVDKTGTMTLPTTSGWQTYADSTTVAVSLSAGQQVMRVEMLSDGFNINWIELGPVLPSPWVSADVGSVGVAGSASHAGGIYTVKGSGADIWGAADAFQYVYQTASGDCDIKAKVTAIGNTHTSAKAGVMIRESLNANSANVLMCVEPNQLIFQYRTATGGACSYSWGGSFTAPYWVRVTRTANVFKGYVSTDGITWTQVGSNVTIGMGSSTYMGMSVLSHVNTTLNTSTFSNVTAVP